MFPVPHASLRATLATATTLMLLITTPSLGQGGVPGEFGPPQAQPLTEARCLPAGGGTGVRLVTEEGDILIGLYDESAPVASENFLNLAEAGYYDGVGFHRLVPGFVIQGGDPEGTGRGGPGYTILDEPVIGTYERGTVAMARTPEPDSQGSQFFIVLDDEAQAALESARTYTIFGTVLDGMDVVDAIAAGETRGGGDDTAVDPVLIESITTEPVELPSASVLAMPEGSSDGASLEARFPTAACGRPFAPSFVSGADIVAGAAEDDPITGLGPLAESVGATLADLRVASAGSGQGATLVGLLAATIPGVPAEQVEAELTRLLLRTDGDAPISDEVVAGRTVRLVSRSGLTGDIPITVLASSETVWYVVAGGDIRDSIVAALP
jgi:cyclophilin family peptidyl-prolyl cis-trans isomerase